MIRAERRRQAARSQERSSYDRLSGWYDLLAASENPFKDRALGLLGLCPGERLLEIGSGTGRTLVAAARQLGVDGLAAGIDLSPGMAAVARRKLGRAHLTGQAALTTGDAAALPYAAQAFDALFLAFTLELFDPPEMTIVLSECRRVLRPGGRLALVSLSKPERPGRPVRLYEWFHRRFPDAIDCRPIPVAATLKENGFSIRVRQQAVMWGLPLEIVLCSV